MSAGTRSSNLLRHLHKGFLPAICSLPVPGYMVSNLPTYILEKVTDCYYVMLIMLLWSACQFGKAIVCSDAAAEAARYGFTAVDRPEGFLVLAIASLGDQATELTSLPEVNSDRCY